MLRKNLIAVLLLLLLLAACGSAEPEAAGSEAAAVDVAETAADEEHDDEEGEHHDEEGEHHDEEGEHHDEEEGEHHDEEEGEHEHAHDADAEMLTLPQLDAVALNGEMLRVVATTSIIGDVVAQVGGDAIALTVLMGPGQDPHSYEPAARDLTAVADAHVIFVNGWDLEEGLEDDLENIGEDVPVVAISANIDPLAFGEDGHDHDEGEEHHDEGEDHEEGEEHAEGDEHAEEDEHGHDHSGADPHVWFSIHNVEQWVDNVEDVLSDLDPANEELYEANADAYEAKLETLEAYVEEQLSQIAADNRFLVTNHDSFGYFAAEYDFTVLGTVIPGASTMAEPSASELAGLITEMEEYAVCTLFTETTVSDTLAQTVAGELSDCDEVRVVKLYTGAVGPEGSGADSYIGMFRANVDAIVAGLGGG